ncbi:hypothetical protein GCM10009565_90460 [Amycolatopsis albidoflavus]
MPWLGAAGDEVRWLPGGARASDDVGWRANNTCACSDPRQQPGPHGWQPSKTRAGGHADCALAAESAHAAMSPCARPRHATPPREGTATKPNHALRPARVRLRSGAFECLTGHIASQTTEAAA